VVKQFGVKKPKKLVTINGLDEGSLINKSILKFNVFQLKTMKCAHLYTKLFLQNLHVSLLQVQSICCARFFKFNANNIDCPTPKF
jgi:hypothetical protein